jgi:hypothetical protein
MGGTRPCTDCHQPRSRFDAELSAADRRAIDGAEHHGVVVRPTRRTSTTGYYGNGWRLSAPGGTIYWRAIA